MKVIIEQEYLDQLEELDAAVRELNQQKIRVLFKALHINPEPAELERMLNWDLIAVSVIDQKMRNQLNGLLPYVPNIIFEVNEADALFDIKPGVKKRRVRKDR